MRTGQISLPVQHRDPLILPSVTTSFHHDLEKIPTSLSKTPCLHVHLIDVLILHVAGYPFTTLIKFLMDTLARSPFLLTQSLWLLVLASDARATHHAIDSPVRDYDQAINNGTLGYYPTWTFMTESELTAPRTNWLRWDPKCDDGMYYFLTPRGHSLPEPGPMILDSRGDLVWSKHFANEWGGQAYDLMVQHYQGKEHLTFWTGDDQIRGHGSGSYTMVRRDSLRTTLATTWLNEVHILTSKPARFFLRNSPRC